MRIILASLCITLAAAAPAISATCGNTGAGFGAWKSEFASTAKEEGVKDRGLRALAAATYSKGTIRADRNQKGVKYALDDFIRIRLGSVRGFASTAGKRIARNPAFFASLEKRYGVPGSILVSIHGMETGFGRSMGSVPVVSSILTVAYDCRRSDFFIPHAIAALQMVDRGMLSPSQLGAFHGEMGHTQFLPGNAMQFGVDGNGDGRVDFYNEWDALASTAYFLRKKGWKKGKGYLPGEPNFPVLNEWNAATVYQKAIAAVAAEIDK
ncbi:Membrane-bound lytic murein transglycosylase B [Candidatus Rhodobacter oscarellae]|uniref:Membrane-bound lytic murein transglycosylase B n=1 Tax=Candidatus Rhodobacter oscarellae TaxID=1675527 RepID=A0A0J9E979_9RHOB|nr:lytic murein transglycosylase [Candidatus Rhodobacter lobularis]KMW58224.1 Membrane-bound lytic murein transglycosylase B [Candidatus Rhodobacter lobularis]